MGQEGNGGFDKFLPGPKAAINVRDFASVEDLVKEIHIISNSEERFNEMLSWKNKPYLPMFQQIINWAQVSDSDHLLFSPLFFTLLLSFFR